LYTTTEPGILIDVIREFEIVADQTR
jgi:hypothetical protein